MWLESQEYPYIIIVASDSSTQIMFLTESLEYSCKNYVINSKRAGWGIFKNVRKNLDSKLYSHNCLYFVF